MIHLDRALFTKKYLHYLFLSVCIFIGLLAGRPAIAMEYCPPVAKEKFSNFLGIEVSEADEITFVDIRAFLEDQEVEISLDTSRGLIKDCDHIQPAEYEARYIVYRLGPFEEGKRDQFYLLLGKPGELTSVVYYPVYKPPQLFLFW